MNTCFGRRPICDLCSQAIATAAFLLLQVLHSTNLLLVSVEARKVREQWHGTQRAAMSSICYREALIGKLINC